MKNHSTYDIHSRYDHAVVVTTMLEYVREDIHLGVNKQMVNLMHAKQKTQILQIPPPLT